MPIELGYWGIRGLAEPCRLLLRYTETEWKDAVLTDADSWFKEKKYNLGLDFPNLPYLLDGDVKLTQSLAVIRYLGRKFGLSPSESDIARGDMLEQYIMDIRMGLGKVSYSSADKFEELKANFLGKIPLYLEEITKFIGAGPFLLGEKITYIDFLALEYLDCVAAFSPDHFKSGPVVDYINRMKNLSALKKFYDSENCTHKSYCINSPRAQWSGAPNKQ